MPEESVGQLEVIDSDVGESKSSSVGATGVAEQPADLTRELSEIDGGISLPGKIPNNHIARINSTREEVGLLPRPNRDLRVVHTGGRPPLARLEPVDFAEIEEVADGIFTAEQNRTGLSDAVAGLQDEYKAKFEEELLQFQIGGELRRGVMGAPRADWEIKDEASNLVYKVRLKGKTEARVHAPREMLPSDADMPYPSLIGDQLELKIYGADGEEMLAQLLVKCRDGRPENIRFQIPFNREDERGVVRNNLTFYEGLSAAKKHVLQSFQMPQRMGALQRGIDPESRLGRLLGHNVIRRSDIALIQRMTGTDHRIERSPLGDDVGLSVNFTAIDVALDSVGRGDPLSVVFSGGEKIVPPGIQYHPLYWRGGHLNGDPVRVHAPDSVSSYSGKRDVVEFAFDGEPEVRHGRLEDPLPGDVADIPQFPSMKAQAALALINDLLNLVPFPSEASKT